MFNSRCCCGGLLALAAFAVFLFPLVDCDGVGGGGREVQWQILTKLNYTSQIRLHRHLLLLVSVPWSGESRFLMKELAHAVASDEHRFGALKLMVLNRNDEKMLADALGANDGITFFYHRNSFSYKYSGRLRVQNILSSLHYAISLSPDELPFRSLSTPDELHDFLQSTDKAVLLLEFCGWTQRLLAKHTLSENQLGKDYFGEDLNKMNNGSFIVEEKDNRKVTDDDNRICSMDSKFNEPNMLTTFTVGNGTSYPGDSCPVYESKNFEDIIKKFAALARDFSLPPERHQFALVCEKSLLPFLNIEEQASWSVAVHFAGCSSCFNLVKEADNLHTVLQAQVSPVLELEDVTHGAEAVLPAEGPTMLLFVDRSSDSLQVRRESQRALDSFREFAQGTEFSHDILKHQNMRPESTYSQGNKASLNTFKQPRLHSFPLSQRIVLTDKMSLMIMKDGKQVSLKDLVPNLQGNSVHEILNYALKSKEVKLSSVAKSAGFQLLSQDFEIAVVDGLPSKGEDQSGQVLSETPIEFESSDGNEQHMLGIETSIRLEELNKPPYVEPIMTEGKDSIESNTEEKTEEGETQHMLGTETIIRLEELNRPPYVEPIMTEGKDSIESNTEEKTEEGETRKTGISEINETKGDYFPFFFYFVDGHHRLLETLTGGLRFPSVVIIDPSSQKHHVLDEHLVLNSSLLSTFAKDFIAGRLPPYIQSGFAVSGSKTAQRPPFVNLDFREKGSIPMVTSRNFAELVYGNTSNPKNSSNSWNKDVLVLFSNDWCGFCQRMELVVREVYRAIKLYTHVKKGSSTEGKWMTIDDRSEDTSSNLPLIYKMDCTINDCSFISQQALQREVYPSLQLFPARRKNDTISYEGDIAVCDIINFLAAHGSSVRHIIMDKSVTHDPKTVKQAPRSRSFPHEVILQDISQNAITEHNQIMTKPPFSSHERPHLSVGCFLFATEKLLGIRPFDESRVLLVKAAESTGFQGVITNKPITWDSVELGQDLGLLREAPVYFGGPVVTRGMPLVALTRKSEKGKSVEVLPSIHFIDQFATVGVLEEIRVGNRSIHDFWFFVGYSGWAWEQLFSEIDRGDWNVSQGSLELLGWP